MPRVPPDTNIMIPKKKEENKEIYMLQLHTHKSSTSHHKHHMRPQNTMTPYPFHMIYCHRNPHLHPQQHLKLHHTTSSRHTAALHTSTTFSASPYIHIIVTLKFYYIEIMNSTYTWPYPKPYIIWRSFRKNPHCTLLRTIRNIYEFFPFFFPLSIFFFLFE